jgi:hypothetical protein
MEVRIGIEWDFRCPHGRLGRFPRRGGDDIRFFPRWNVRGADDVGAGCRRDTTVQISGSSPRTRSATVTIQSNSSPPPGAIQLGATHETGITAGGGDFGLSGNWFDPATSGQGFVVDLNPVAKILFFAW